jgi:hypothetical protein
MMRNGSGKQLATAEMIINKQTARIATETATKRTQSNDMDKMDRFVEQSRPID